MKQRSFLFAYFVIERFDLLLFIRHNFIWKSNKKKQIYKFSWTRFSFRFNFDLKISNSKRNFCSTRLQPDGEYSNESYVENSMRLRTSSTILSSEYSYSYGSSSSKLFNCCRIHERIWTRSRGRNGTKKVIKSCLMIDACWKPPRDEDKKRLKVRRKKTFIVQWSIRENLIEIKNRKVVTRNRRSMKFRG